MFHVPNKWRVKEGALGSDENFGNNGYFVMPWRAATVQLNCQASDGLGFEHVSVSVREIGAPQPLTKRCPTWEEMCRVKDVFWDEEDTVIQYHPPKSKYVNCHPYVLHLWRPLHYSIPVPDPALIGIPPDAYDI